MPSLAAIGYLCLAIDLATRAGEAKAEARGKRRRSRFVEVGDGQVLDGLSGGFGLLARQPGLIQGNTISAAQMRGLSPTFLRPPKATLHRNVATLQGRIDKIRDMIRKGALDPAVRKATIAVLSKRNPDGSWAVPEKDWEAEAKALFHFVRRNVRYQRDPIAADTYVHPARTLFDVVPGSGGAGDCDDYSATLGAMLAAAGHKVVLRAGAVKNPGEPPGWNHIWLRDCLPEGGAVARRGGKCIPLDASVNKPPGWEAPKNRLHRVQDFEV